jgi:hypothetical protein
MPSHYTSPEFFREPYFDARAPFAVLAVVQGEARGVMTGFHDGPHVSCGLPTRPQIQLLDDEFSALTVATLVRGLAQEANGAATVSVYTWDADALDGLMQQGFRRKQISSIPRLDLTVGAEALLKKCDRTRRQAIRSAAKSGVTVAEAATEEDHRAFHEIYKMWCGGKALPCFSDEVEDRAFRDTMANRNLFLARHEGKIIAGSSFRFFPGGLVEYSRNSSLPDTQSLKPNDALLWHGIEWAIAAGFKQMSMGASHRYLRLWGGEMSPVYRYRRDKTLLRRHDRKEELLEWGAKTVAKLPPEREAKIRKLLKKEKQPGW